LPDDISEVASEPVTNDGICREREAVSGLLDAPTQIHIVGTDAKPLVATPHLDIGRSPDREVRADGVTEVAVRHLEPVGGGTATPPIHDIGVVEGVHLQMTRDEIRLLCRTGECLQPARVDLVIAVAEGDQLTPSRRDACIARVRQAWCVTRIDDPDAGNLVCPSVNQIKRVVDASVVDYDELPWFVDNLAG
jgi:hypothetical protein